MSTHSIWLFSADEVTGPYKLVNGPLTPQYNNDATLYEDEDGQTYLYCSGNGLFQAKIDLPSGKLVGEIENLIKDHPVILNGQRWNRRTIHCEKDGIFILCFFFMDARL